MAQPDCDDGYTRIANELLEAIVRFPFSKRQYKVVFALARKTYGFNKKSDEITMTKLANMTGLARPHVSKTVAELVAMGAVLKRYGKKYQTLSINKDYGQWQGYQNSTTYQNSTGGVPKQSHSRTKTVPTKDNTKRQPQKTGGGAKRATAFPTDFAVSKEMVDWATEKVNLSLIDLKTETEKFADYHRAKGSTMRDWVAAWRNWMRKAEGYAKRDARKGSFEDRIAAIYQ